MTKEQRWQKINEMRAEISKLSIELNKFGLEFAKDYCTFKEGDKVIVNQECAVVTRIGFDPDCAESNLSSVVVEYYIKGWARPQQRRNREMLRPCKLLGGKKWNEVIKKVIQ